MCHCALSWLIIFVSHSAKKEQRTTFCPRFYLLNACYKWQWTQGTQKKHLKTGTKHHRASLFRISQFTGGLLLGGFFLHFIRNLFLNQYTRYCSESDDSSCSPWASQKKTSWMAFIFILQSCYSIWWISDSQTGALLQFPGGTWKA